MTTILLILSLIQGLTLRGTVFAGADKPAANATVTIVGDKGTSQTVSGADGTFQFNQLPPGKYELNAQLGKLSGHPTTISVSRDMEGVGIVLKPVVNPVVFGTVKMDGDDPLPSPLPRIVMKYPSGTVAGRFDIDRRGMFFFALSSPESMVSLENLKEPYFVKSMTAGNVDLMKDPLKLGDAATINSISIILGIRK